jgi:hypothetical protein
MIPLFKNKSPEWFLKCKQNAYNLKRILFILIILALICTVACFSNQKLKQIVHYKDLAFQRFGADTSFLVSPGKNYVLCLKITRDQQFNPNAQDEFFIFDIVGKSEIYSDKLAGASFQWQSDYELMITEQRGIIDSRKDSGKIYYLYNVKTKKKINLQKPSSGSVMMKK